MAERLSSHRQKQPFQFDRNTLWLIGLVLCALGIMGRGILQNRVLGMADNPEGLTALLDASPDAMNAATAAVILEAVSCIAIPIFAVLTVDGFQRTGSIRKYLLRVGIMAFVSEFLYNLALTGKLWDVSSRNPVFGLLLVLVTLYLLQSFDHLGTFVKGLLHLFVLMCAALWMLMFRVEFGLPVLLMSYMLWIFRNRHTMAYMGAAATALVCSVSNPLLMFAPFGLLAAHFYRGEKGNDNPLRYILYPAVLALTWLAGVLIF